MSLLGGPVQNFNLNWNRWMEGWLKSWGTVAKLGKKEIRDRFQVVELCPGHVVSCELFGIIWILSLKCRQLMNLCFMLICTCPLLSKLPLFLSFIISFPQSPDLPLKSAVRHGAVIYRSILKALYPWYGALSLITRVIYGFLSLFFSLCTFNVFLGEQNLLGSCLKVGISKQHSAHFSAITNISDIYANYFSCNSWCIWQQ